jgi:hypothetical protein
VNPQDLHTQKLSQCNAASSTKVLNGHLLESQMLNSFQVHALPITKSSILYPPKLCVLDILDRV